MKFYGIALAAVPRKDNPDIIDVICNSIAVSHNDRDHIEILKEPLSFKTSFDSRKTGGVMSCFTRIVSTIDEVVKLQHKSCKDCQHYWPVALEFGEDNRKPMNNYHWASPHNLLTMQLFGKRLKEPLTNTELAKQLIMQSFGSEFTNAPFEDSAVLMERAAKKVALDDILKAFMENTDQEDKIAYARRAREDFLKKNTDCLNEFYHACSRLPVLLNNCSLVWSSYGAAGPDNPVDSELAEQLRQIKKTFKDGKPGASMLITLTELARRVGETHATLNDNHEGGGAFEWSAPRGYRENPQMREQYPNYGFVDWDPAIRTAFYEGYYRTKKGTRNATFNLPLDPHMPPFVTPCADMVRDMLDAANGLTHPDSRDTPEWRERLSQMASNQSEATKLKR